MAVAEKEKIIMNNMFKSLPLYTIAFAFVLAGNSQAEEFSLSVALSDSIRPVTHVASGSLYGLTESLPSDFDSLVAPLKPNVFVQPALSGSTHQQTVAAAAIPVSARLASTTGKVQIRLADVLPGWPYKWPGQASWLASVTSVINSKIASGRTNYDGYEIWNEPNDTWKVENGDFYTECWKPTYNLIRSMDPDAKIIGPSYSWYNSDKVSEFMTYCKKNDCLPDVMSWHQWGSAGLSSNIDKYRALETSLGISHRAISINEYSSTTHDYEGSPGVSVPFIAKFERKMVESAAISWWFTGLPGRLGSLLTSKNEKGGGWWLYKWYGDMTGYMANVTPPNDNSEGVDGFASLDKNEHYASIVIGGNSIGSVNVKISGFPASFGSSVYVKLEYVTWVNKDTPVSGTTLISTKEYQISNGSITVPVNVTSQFFAYRLYVTPVVTVVSPVVQFTSPTKDTSVVASATINFVVAASDANGTVTQVKFYDDKTLLSSDDTAPYTYEWTDIPAGIHTIRAVATDNDGNTSQDSIHIGAQAPYGGTSWSIPGTIEIENYDVGGEGVAYSDNETENRGGAYRTDGVDIEGDATNGYKVGYTITGEWLEYTVNIEAADTYTWEARVASGGTTGAFQVLIDDIAITDTIRVPSTTEWSIYTTLTGKTPALTTGPHIMRLVVDGDYFNMDWISFKQNTFGLVHMTSTVLSNLTTYQVYDLRGKKLGDVKGSNDSELHVALAKAFPHPGVYIVKSVTMQGTVIRKWAVGQ